MLEQLIYTRCAPRIDLRSGGRVIPADGFGVFNVSPGVLEPASQIDLDYLSERLALKNGANEAAGTGLFHSYEYNRLGAGQYALSYEYTRRCSPDPDEPGASLLHGIFVKQCLVGRPEGRPCDWFGADVWTAWQVSESEYKRTGAGPQPLPRVPACPQGGRVDRQTVAAFVHSGREEAVRAGLWFLLQEYAKPENERRVLLIRDTPEHVELWVAAFQHALSPAMARELTFATNRTRLSGQEDSALFRYTVETENGSPRRSRRPHCMVTGFHPADAFCSAVRPGGAAGFELIDGVSGRSSIRPDNSVRQPFFEAAVRYDEELTAFHTLPIGRLPLEAAAGVLPRLYDAAGWLEGKPAAYSEALALLRLLLSFDWGQEREFLARMLERGLAELRACTDEEMQSGWQLSAELYALAQPLHRAGPLTDFWAEFLAGCFREPDQSAAVLAALLQALERRTAAPCMLPPLSRLLRAERLPGYTQRLETARPESAAAVLELFLWLAEELGTAEQELLQDETVVRFLTAGLAAANGSGPAVQRLLKRLAGKPRLLEQLVAHVTNRLAADDRSRDAWLTALFTASDFDLVPLYRAVRRAPGTTIDTLEELLLLQLRQPGADPDGILQEFPLALQELGDSGNSGLNLYSAILRQTPPGQLGERIDAIRRSGLNPRVQLRLFAQVDGRMPYPDKGSACSDGIERLRDWGKALGYYSNTAELFDFCRRLNAARAENEVFLLAEQYHRAGVLPDGRFTAQPLFAGSVKRAARFGVPQVHAALLTMFPLHGGELQRYVNGYVEAVLDGEKLRYVQRAAELYQAWELIARQENGSRPRRPADEYEALMASRAASRPDAAAGGTPTAAGALLSALRGQLRRQNPLVLRLQLKNHEMRGGAAAAQALRQLIRG